MNDVVVRRELAFFGVLCEFLDRDADKFEDGAGVATRVRLPSLGQSLYSSRLRLLVLGAAWLTDWVNRTPNKAGPRFNRHFCRSGTF